MHDVFTHKVPDCNKDNAFSIIFGSVEINPYEIKPSIVKAHNKIRKYGRTSLVRT